jgi:hypothetical protein
MNLYFLASNGEKRLVSTDVAPETAHKEISKYVKELNPNYEIYYVRYWRDEATGGTMYDIGSHSEFFLLVDEN